MGVEYEIRCEKCKERVILYKLRESYEPVRQIVDGVFKSSELLQLPDWVKALIDDHRMWQIKESLKFKERHPNCELFFWNDHADFDDEEGPFYPEMDEKKTLPRTEEFEANMKEKSRLYVKDGFITNRHGLPYDYMDREDLIKKIPCGEPIRKLIYKYPTYEADGFDGEWEEYVEYILVAKDEGYGPYSSEGRLFKYSPRSMSGCFISPEDLEVEIETLKNRPERDFEVVELEGAEADE